MQIEARGLKHLLVYLAVALLGGCGGVPSAPGRPTLPAAPRPARHGAVKSWMAANANKDNLLYVTITDGAVNVYSYPRVSWRGN